MKRLVLSILIYCSLSTFLLAQNTLAEKLGYSKEDKLLIVHADDLGLTHSENLASIMAMRVGVVNSASIMMPCPWVMEIADYAQKNPDADFGLHLTLTSEWKYMKWGPVAPLGQVQSLVNELGHFHEDCVEFGQKAKVEEAEIELRAQIELAYKMGIQPTHLDTHMGCLVFNSPELFDVYLKLGREYKIPVLIGRFFLQAAPKAFKDLIQPEDIIIEKVLSAGVSDFENGMTSYYEKTFKGLEEGINVLLIHLAYSDTEMQGLSVDHPNWGAKWRQDDFDYFTSEQCKKTLEEEGIKLVTWRQIQKVMYGDK